MYSNLRIEVVNGRAVCRDLNTGRFAPMPTFEQEEPDLHPSSFVPVEDLEQDTFPAPDDFTIRDIDLDHELSLIDLSDYEGHDEWEEYHEQADSVVSRRPYCFHHNNGSGVVSVGYTEYDTDFNRVRIQRLRERIRVRDTKRTIMRKRRRRIDYALNKYGDALGYCLLYLRHGLCFEDAAGCIPGENPFKLFATIRKFSFKENWTQARIDRLKSVFHKAKMRHMEGELRDAFGNDDDMVAAMMYVNTGDDTYSKLAAFATSNPSRLRRRVKGISKRLNGKRASHATDIMAMLSRMKSQKVAA